MNTKPDTDALASLERIVRAWDLIVRGNPSEASNFVPQHVADNWAASFAKFANDELIRLASQAPSGDVRGRCEICDWPLADSRENGCVPGDCSYRPADPAEQQRIRERRAALTAAPKLDAENISDEICKVFGCQETCDRKCDAQNGKTLCREAAVRILSLIDSASVQGAKEGGA